MNLKGDGVGQWIGSGLLALWAGFLLWRELRRPLRPRESEPKLTRDARNLTVAAAGGATTLLIAAPVLVPLVQWVETRGWGFVPRLNLPGPVAAAASVILLDYGYYVWHVLTHKIPLIWRFHKVHHVDLDLDASTALRFHFGELVFSVPYVALTLVAIGPSADAFRLWQFLFAASVLFHHSNAALPLRLERALQWVVVTPRMHGIHHSIVGDEVNSNWSSGLTLWDRLHGTLKLGLPQREITIGVVGYLEPESVRLPRLMTMPFTDPPMLEPFPKRTIPPPQA